LNSTGFYFKEVLGSRSGAEEAIGIADLSAGARYRFKEVQNMTLGTQRPLRQQRE
jgi:hypothetical protein